MMEKQEMIDRNLIKLALYVRRDNTLENEVKRRRIEEIINCLSPVGMKLLEDVFIF